MVASAARFEANRRNAARSTGPKTAEGKARSRANALRHGLTAEVLRTADDEKAAREWADRRPEAATSHVLDASWLAEEIAVIQGRIERVGELDDRNRERVALRAGTTWSDDRRREAEALGSTIDRNPSEVVRRLEEMTQGCDWIIGRWAMLARVADLGDGWDEPARALAFDLLGTPRPLRKGEPGQEIDLDGRLVAEIPGPADLARGQVRRLLALRDRIAPLDEFDRESASLGLSGITDPVDRRLRRYESALHARLRWYLDRLGEATPPSADPANEPAPEPAATGPAPAVEQASPSSVEPEPEQAGGIGPEEGPPKVFPAAPVPRRERKARKVEIRRAAAERKLARRLG